MASYFVREFATVYVYSRNPDNVYLSIHRPLTRHANIDINFQSHYPGKRAGRGGGGEGPPSEFIIFMTFLLSFARYFIPRRSIGHPRGESVPLSLSLSLSLSLVNRSFIS